MNNYKRYTNSHAGLFTNLASHKRSDTIKIDESRPLDEKQVKEALEKGLVQLAKTSDRCYGYYRMQCGHNSFLHYGAIRKAKSSDFSCKTCLDIKLADEAKKFDLIYDSELDTTHIKKSDCRYYTFPCGHTRLLKIANIRHSKVACDVCKELQFKEEAEQQNLKWTGKTDNRNRRLYTLPCSHTKYISIGAVRSGSWRCRVCQDLKYSNDAKLAGIEYLQDTKSSHHNFRVYRLGCGCIKEITPTCVANCAFECKTHDERYLDFSQPISVYLMEFTLPIGNVLKLGFAADLQGRQTRYYLQGTSELIYSIKFAEGQKAVDLEKAIHVEYKNSVLDKELMRKYMQNGFTECYPIELKTELIKKLLEARIE